MIKAIIIVGFIAAVILVIFYMLAPNDKRDCSKFTNVWFAHRGLHEIGESVENLIPENSLAAFRRAREQGYGVELDVQYTKDGQIVVFHDSNLERMCGSSVKVAELTYEELQQYRLNGTEEKIPLFKDVLDTLVDVPLVCEIKNHNGNKNDKLCEETYELLEGYAGDYCIESFSPFLVKWFRDNKPEVIRGQLSCDCKGADIGIISGFLLTHLLVNVFSRPDFIAYRHKDTAKLGFVLCRIIYHPLLVGWTARGKAEQDSAARKFDSVIFELFENDNPVE